MSENEFNLEIFIDKAWDTPSMDDDIIQTRCRTLEVFRMILDNSKTTKELLNACTLQEVEWAFDMALYWPSYEASIEDADLDDWGVQHAQIRDLVRGLSVKKSIKQKVVFI
jgi:hypothetical protein